MIIKPGQKYNRLTVVQYAGGKDGWLCKCTCGKEITATRSDLLKGRAQSCGCYRRDQLLKRLTTHGKSHTPEYKNWAGMIARCYCETNPAYKDYGGRGIKVCPEWRNNFPAFLSYVGPRPTKAHSIDRFPNNNGNYEPGNVRWATRDQQNSNKRSNVLFQIDGETLTAEEVTRRLGFSRSTSLLYRIRMGWSIEDAITIPKGGTRADRTKGSLEPYSTYR